MTTPPLTAAASLGTLIMDVAEGRRELGTVLDVVQRWEADMAGREKVAIEANDGKEGTILAIRARGMHLGALALGVRLQLLLDDAVWRDSVIR